MTYRFEFVNREHGGTMKTLTEAERLDNLRRIFNRNYANRVLALDVLGVPDEWLDEYLDTVTSPNVAKDRTNTVN